MFVNTVFRRFLFSFCFLIVSFFILFLVFYPLFVSNNIVFSLPCGLINLSDEYPILWERIKILYLIFFVLSNLFYSNMIYPVFFNKNKMKYSNLERYQLEDLHLNVLDMPNAHPIIIPKEGLYQNILITGTIRYRKN